MDREKGNPDPMPRHAKMGSRMRAQRGEGVVRDFQCLVENKFPFYLASLGCVHERPEREQACINYTCCTFTRSARIVCVSLV